MSFKAILSAVGQGIKSAKEKYEEERLKETSLMELWKSDEPGVYIDPVPRPQTLKFSDALKSDADTVHLVGCDEDDSKSTEALLAFTKYRKRQVVELEN